MTINCINSYSWQLMAIKLPLMIRTYPYGSYRDLFGEVGKYELSSVSMFGTVRWSLLMPTSIRNIFRSSLAVVTPVKDLNPIEHAILVIGLLYAISKSGFLVSSFLRFEVSKFQEQKGFNAFVGRYRFLIIKLRFMSSGGCCSHIKDLQEFIRRIFGICRPPIVLNIFYSPAY